MVTASRTGSVRRASVSSAESRASPYSSVASTSIPAREAQRPISQPAPASASSSRAAYGAPEAPVMPRKTRMAPTLLGTLGGLEEDGELVQVVVAEIGERRHRRARVDATRALEVVDLELDALVLRALGGEIGRAEVRAARAEIGVAVRAARHREEVRARECLLVVLEALLLGPARDRRLDLAGDRLLRDRALVGENAHREHHQRGGHDRDRPAREPPLGA